MNKSSDGMFVRRRNPHPSSRATIDGMQSVPSKFLNQSQMTDGQKSDVSALASASENKDAPPVQRSRDIGEEITEQLRHNDLASAVDNVTKPVDIDMSLDDSGENSKKRKGRSRGERKHWFWPPRLPSKRVVIVLIFLILAFGGYFGYRVLNASSHIFQGNVLTALFSSSKPLKTDQNGNTNVLLLGTSESDPNHPGAQLTDSMMMVSVNQKSKQVFLLSIPRDLWVTYDEPCSAGYSGKINAVYECALGTSQGGLSNTQNDETTAENATATKVSKVVGANIQYVVHMNLAVIQKVVDAVGGIDITIESPDPRGILDRNFDWRCNYTCYLVKYPNGPVHLNGTNAMWLAQARNDAGGYGLPRSNFDREANQRKIVIATKDKATSVGFLANPVNVLNLLDALGNNIHTTIDSSEVKTFVDVIKNTPSTSITSIDIQNDGKNVLTTGTGPDGSSIIEPVAGLENYNDLQAFVSQLLQGQAPLVAEHATVDVLNGSGTSGAAATEANTLKNAGFAIGNVASAPTMQGKYLLYDLSSGKKPTTLKKLEDQLGLTAATDTKLPAGMSSTATFVVVVGQQPTSASSSGQ